MCGAKSDEEAVYCDKCGIGFTPVQPQAPKNAKSRVAAGVMGFFVGFLGVHNFYLGYTVKAIFQLVLGLAWLWMIFIGALIGGSVACILLGMLMSLASAIWAFIEVILLLCGVKNTDGKGNQLKD
jgi:TM2 domain-containing membrane protein YozV